MYNFDNALFLPAHNQTVFQDNKKFFLRFSWDDKMYWISSDPIRNCAAVTTMIVCFSFIDVIYLSGILENKLRLRQDKSLFENAAPFDHNWGDANAITFNLKHQNNYRNKAIAG